MGSATRHHAAGITSPSSGVWSSSIIGCFSFGVPIGGLGPGGLVMGLRRAGVASGPPGQGSGACRRCPRPALPPPRGACCCWEGLCREATPGPGGDGWGGITNIMMVTVTERTREIGIRKALGAPKRTILTQFLVEATVLSLIGGLLGTLAAVAGSQVTIVSIKPVIVPSSVVLALTVSVAIGLFFGSYPASRAAALRPIEALRYE